MRLVSNADPDRYEMSAWGVLKQVIGVLICLPAFYLAYVAVVIGGLLILGPWYVSPRWVGPALGIAYLVAVLCVPFVTYVGIRRRRMTPRGKALTLAAGLSLILQIPFLWYVVAPISVFG